MDKITSSPIYAIETEGLTKSFGTYPALRGIDLKVERRDCLVILGPNGAGKTTLIKVLANIMNPSSGKIRVFGIDTRANAEKACRLIGVVSHRALLYGNLTAYENMEFYARMYSVPHYKERIQELVALVGLTPRLHDRIATLSRGMQQRLSVARALLHQPEIVLLDEPETGLDQQALSTMWQILKGEKPERRTLVITTHRQEQALELGNRVVILCQGKIACERAIRDLDLASLRQDYLESTRGKA